MRVNSKICILFVMLFAGVATSCAPELESDVSYMETVETEVYFSFSEMETKSLDPSDEDPSLKDVWVFQFSGTGNDAQLMARPRFYTVTDNSSTAEFTKSDDCTVVFIANTHDAHISWKDIACLGDIRSKRFHISDMKDCYDPDMNDIVSMAVVSDVDFASGSPTLTPVLSRLFARIDFTLSDSSTEMEILSVQLCNVPEMVEYIPHVLTSGETYPSAAQSIRVDYPAEEFSGMAKTYHWYIPRNEQGVSASRSHKTKNQDAPAEATYVKITAKDDSGAICEYRIYPGANLESDFNLKPNHAYKIDIDIKTKGDPLTDSRVRRYDPVSLDEDDSKANSFMVHPVPHVSGSKRVFSFYPHVRVNQYWTEYNDTPSMVIGETTAWTAELLWEDTAGLIKFVDGSGNEVDTFSAVGKAPLSLNVANGSCGNGVVVVKNGHGTVLWSWHIWVTDYNPEYREDPQEGKFIYPVEGGAVHRYVDGKGKSYWKSANWYAGKYIMDRNLGAATDIYPLSSTGQLSGTDALKGHLSYQWGRKDPFCTDFKNIHKREDTTTGVAIATAIANPSTFYAKSGDGSNNWAVDGPNTSTWNDPKVVTSKAGKSVFDPCPKGWAVPHSVIWSGFTNTRAVRAENKTSDFVESTVLEPERAENLRWDYNGMPGCRYWPAGYDVPDNPIYYPAVGGISSSGSPSWAAGTRVAVWSSVTTTFCDFYTTGTTGSAAQWLVTNSAYKAYGMAIRCIQIDE